MKYGHYARLRVISKPEENEDEILKALLTLVPFNIEEEKIKLDTTIAHGFNERNIKIFEIELKKDKHINHFVKSLKEKISPEQKALLLRQVDSRLDDDLNFYVRFDKEKLLNNQFWITDDGNCFHIVINIAVFPKKKEVGQKAIVEMFGLG